MAEEEKAAVVTEYVVLEEIELDTFRIAGQYEAGRPTAAVEKLIEDFPATANFAHIAVPVRSFWYIEAEEVEVKPKIRLTASRPKWTPPEATAPAPDPPPVA